MQSELISIKWVTVALLHLTNSSRAELMGSFFVKTVHIHWFLRKSMHFFKKLFTYFGTLVQYQTFYRSLLIAQSGIIHYFEKRSYYNSPYWACSTHELISNGSRPSAIKLNQFWAVFLILIIGCFASVILFLGEILFFTYQRPRHR